MKNGSVCIGKDLPSIFPTDNVPEGIVVSDVKVICSNGTSWALKQETKIVP